MPDHLHKDALAELNLRSSVTEKLHHIHQVTRLHFDFITRIAVALYDADTDRLRTFVYSGAESPLNHYEARLSDCYSLQQVALSQRPRLEQDLAVFSESTHEHAVKIYQAGYRASYTVPMIWEGQLLGFVFFNADREQPFDARCLSELDVVSHLVTVLMYNELSNVRTLLATLRSALDLTHSRDPETGCHLERMSRYARLIARQLAPHLGFDDHFIEHVFLFAPLHDLGKLTIPDSILLKAGPLDEDEYAVMKTHADTGYQLIERLLSNYGLGGVSHVQMLRNIVRHHHEAMDGSGYPDGLRGDAIPIEARIVTVADIFDALTSRRPYKERWSNERAFQHLQAMTPRKLDPDCVAALLAVPQEIEQIQAVFLEETFG